MKRKVQSLLLAAASIFLTACDGEAGTPSCTDARTQKGARLAIENSYISARLSDSSGKFFVDKLPSLQEHTDEAVKRNYVRFWKLRSADDLRLCRAELMENSYMLVVIARNPNAPNDFGYVAYNIGLPPQLTVAEGWLND